MIFIFFCRKLKLKEHFYSESSESEETKSQEKYEHFSLLEWRALLENSTYQWSEKVSRFIIVVPYI